MNQTKRRKEACPAFPTNIKHNDFVSRYIEKAPGRGGFVIDLIFLYNILMLPKKSEKPKMAEVISIVAHQLKNPLSVIKGYIEVLLSEDMGKINKQQREYLADVMENTKRMARIINYLLDVSKIEEGKYELKLEKVFLDKIVSEVIEDFANWAKASNCEIIFKNHEKIPAVLVDPFRIRQVIENLLSNAIKYRGTGPGKIEIKIEEKGKELLFSCEDTGISIPQKDFAKVFSKFYRSEEAMELDPAGTGLGLYINKAIVELSKGKIWFKSNKNYGITFFFTLPIAK